MALNNLGNILSYRQSFSDIPIGYSDHTVGIDCAFYSLTLGASFLEVHFTDSVESFGPDHLLSKSSQDILDLKNKFMDYTTSFGEFHKSIQACEYETWRTQKKALYASVDINEGELISSKNTYLASPPLGVCPSVLEHNNRLIATYSITKDSPISADAFTL